jgi:monofunctional biosynthetic peptidoglycan transglycosylase
MIAFGVKPPPEACKSAVRWNRRAPFSSTRLMAEEDAMKVFDFSDERAAAEWFAIGDQVMGGVSSGGLRHEGQWGVFEGEVSLENGGGFFSVRSQPQRRDLSEFAGLAARVRGDGQRYKLRLKTDDRFDGIVYQALIEPPAGKWTTLEVPFTDFGAVFRGRPVPDAPPLDPARVQAVGLLISDGQAGPFRLEIAWLEAYGSPSTDR